MTVRNIEKKYFSPVPTVLELEGERQYFDFYSEYLGANVLQPSYITSLKLRIANGLVTSITASFNFNRSIRIAPRWDEGKFINFRIDEYTPCCFSTVYENKCYGCGEPAAAPVLAMTFMAPDSFSMNANGDEIDLYAQSEHIFHNNFLQAFTAVGLDPLSGQFVSTEILMLVEELLTSDASAGF